MKFDIETKQDMWTLDDSLPLKIYSKDFEELIIEICLDKEELLQLKKEINRGLTKIKQLEARRLDEDR